MAFRIAMIAYTHYESDPRVKREAEALAGRGDQVHVWALAADGASSDGRVENGVHVHRVSMPRYRGGKALAYVSSYGRFMAVVAARVSKAHVETRFDLVHVHTMPDFMVFAALIPRLAGAKVLLDMHDLMPELYALKFGLKKKGMVVAGLRAMQRAATSFADAVVCVHQPQYELLLRDGVPAYKLHIVMNAADSALFPRRKQEPPTGKESPIRVVYHGTILERYGVDLLVRAFALARQRDPRLQLAIYGGGDFVDRVREVAREEGLRDDHFRMDGKRMPMEAIANAIRDAHIGVAPNRDDQEDSVLPTKLLEYVAVGIPSVASKTRCVARFFNGTEVELVPVGDIAAMADAIVRMAQDGKLRKERVANGYKWEEEYGWEVNKRNLFRLIDGLLYEKKAASKASGPKTPQTSEPAPKVNEEPAAAPPRASSSKTLTPPL